MPTLGKATYYLELNTKDFDQGMAKAEVRAARTTDAIAAQMGVASKSVETLGTTTAATAREVEVASGQMAMSFEEAGAAGTQMGTEVAAGAKVAGDASVAQAQKTAFAWDAAAKRMTGIGKKMRHIGKELTHKVTLPVALVGGIAAKMSLDFGKAMTDIEALVGAGEEDMRLYREESLRLAREGPAGPKELAEALYFITSSGFEADRAIKVLAASALASKAGLGETALVADVVTSAVTAYGEAALSAERATDIMVGTIRLGKGEPADLARVLGHVVAPAENLGIEFNELAGLMASLSLVGIDFFEGATQMRGIMMSLIKPSKAGREVIEEYYGSTDKLRAMIADDFVGTLVDMRDKFKDNKEALAKIFPNVRAFTGFVTAMGKASKKTISIQKELAGNIGETGIAADIAAKDPLVKLQTAWSRIEVQLVELGEHVVPWLVRIAEAVAAVAEAFGKLPGPVKVAVAALVGILAVAGPLLSMIGLMVIGFGGLAAALTRVGLAGGTAATGLNATAAATGRARLALIGKAGLAGAALLAGYEIGNLGIKLLGLEDNLRSAGSWAYDLAGKLGLVSDAASGVGDLKFQVPEVQKKLVEAYIKARDLPEVIRDKAVEQMVGKGYTFRDAEIFYKQRLRHATGPGGPGGLVPGAPTRKEPTKPTEPPLREFEGYGIGIMTREALAQQSTKVLSDDLAVEKEKEAFLRKLLAQRKLQGKKRLAVQQELGKVMQQIESLTSQMAPEEKEPVLPPLVPRRIEKMLIRAEGTERLSDDVKAQVAELRYLRALLKKLPEKKENLERRHEIEMKILEVQNDLRATRKAAKEEDVRELPELITSQIRIKKTLATRTEGLKDDIKAEQAHLRYQQRLLRELPKTKKYLDQRATIMEGISDSMQRLKELNEQIAQQAKDAGKAMREMAFNIMGERAGFFGTFGSNVFTQTTGPTGETQRQVGVRGASPAFSQGGIVGGGGSTDSVSARLTPGEGVLTKRTVRAIAYDLGLGTKEMETSGRLNSAEATGKTVTIEKFVNEQHFTAPTTDRHREARYAKIAVESVFDGVGAGAM